MEALFFAHTALLFRQVEFCVSCDVMHIMRFKREFFTRITYTLIHTIRTQGYADFFLCG